MSGIDIVLASQSPRRKKLLKQMGVNFITVPSGADENTTLVRPSAIVRSLAIRKADFVARAHPDAAVIGSDTIVVCKGRILGKPMDEADALELLRLENGSWQSVYTGVAVICKNRGLRLSGYEISRCKARHFTDDQLKQMAGRHLDKAGAYAVQDTDDKFIEKIEGNFDNVVGFPCGLVRRLLKECGAV